jgi:hypothetical protein
MGWGIDRNTYTVRLVKRIGGVRIASWRRHGHRATKNIKMIPYLLATYLQLIPDANRFSDKLYDFSCNDLDELKTCEVVTKITRRGTHAFVTIDLSKV